MSCANENAAIATALANRRTILIHNCDNAITADEMKAIFSCMGDIVHLKKQFNVEMNEFCWLLEYAQDTSASDAIEALQNYKLLGKELRIGYVDEAPTDRTEEELPQKLNKNQLVIDFLSQLAASEGFPSWANIATAHQEHVPAELKKQVQSNDQKAADLIHSLIEFLTNNSAKTYQSWLYSDLKGISTESTEGLLEVPLADARKLEEAIANRNYIFFEGVSDAVSLDNLRARLYCLSGAGKIDAHELESTEHAGRKIIIDLGSTEQNTRLAALQILILDGHYMRIHVANKNA